MYRKTHLLVAALLVIVMFVSTSAAGAYTPTLQSATQNQPKQGFFVDGVAVAQPDEHNPPTAALRSAANLRASLTATQQRAIQAILKRYESQLAAIAARLPALRDSLAPSTDPAAAEARVTEDAAAFQTVQQANQRAKTLQAQLDNEVGAVLTDEQRALHQAALVPITVDASASTVTTQAADGGQSRASGSASILYNADYNSSYCYYAAYYSTFADYYSYFARYYGYYNYYYYGSYNPYYYLHNANAYAISGHFYISAVYFDELVLHADPFDRASAGRSDEANATNNAYYGRYYAQQDYETYGYTYAYYANYYGYYANVYAYYAYTYAAYC